jgi:menaquinone-dependent protoporphyrinogen oxidase
VGTLANGDRKGDTKVNVLVAVASKHGSTVEIGEAIAEELRAAGHTAEARLVGEVEGLAGYDAVVLGSAVYMGSWLPEARQFAEEYHSQLEKVPVWIFSSGPLGTDDPQPHDDPARFAAPMGDVPVRDHKVFVGKLAPDGLGLAERLATKMVHAPYGDFRDWNDIREWARGIGEQLGAADTGKTQA